MLIKLLFCAAFFVSGENDSIPAVQLPHVEVNAHKQVGKEIATPFATPQTVSVVTKGSMTEKMQYSLKDITTDVAGVTAYSGFDEYTIRGFRAENARMFNGLRGYNMTYTSPLLTHIERVEILKGPVALLYGNGDPGGSINLITKKPQAEASRQVSFAAGSYNRWRAQTDLTGAVTADKKLLYRFNAGYDQSQPFRMTRTARNWQVAPSFSYYPADKIHLHADFALTGIDGQIDRGQPAAYNSAGLLSTPVTYTLSAPEDYLRETNMVSSLRFSYQLHPRISFHSGYLNYMAYQKAAEHRFSGYLGTGGIETVADEWKYNTMTHTFSNYFTFRFHTGILRHHLLAGYDFIRSDGDIDKYIWEEPDTEEYSTYGIYLQDEISLGKWKLVVGLRHESYTGEEEEGGEGEDEEEFTQQIWLPQVALSYQPVPQLNLYVTYHKGFDPFEATGERQRFESTLKPIVSQLWEAGVKTSLCNDRFSASLALYQLTVRNTAVYANNPAEPDLYIQRGEDRARGVELEVRGEPVRHLEVSVNYAFNRAAVTRSEVASEIGTTKENAPRHGSNSWIRYTIPRSVVKGLSVAVGHALVSRRHTLEEGFTLPGYCLLNAGLGYSFRNLDVSLYLENLTNRTYWLAGYDQISKWPGRPRNLMTSINYKF